jgi:hypothetical protein
MLRKNESAAIDAGNPEDKNQVRLNRFLSDRVAFDGRGPGRSLDRTPSWQSYRTT